MRWLVWMTTVVCLALPRAGLAQVGGGQMMGLVTDQAGAAVPGATVTATSTATNAARQHGVLVGRPLRDCRAEAWGVPPRRRAERLSNRASRGHSRRDRPDDPRSTSSSRWATSPKPSAVTADAPMLRATASLGQVVSEEKITALPLNGRTFITLAALAPGVALPPGSQLPRINGGRPRTNEYLFDGISVLQPEPGQVAFFPVVDAIQEFKIETQQPAGRVRPLQRRRHQPDDEGGRERVARHRLRVLPARGAERAQLLSPPTGDKPEFRRNQFGGVARRPGRQDRTFFFVDYQGQRQSIGRTVISTVPTVLQRQGIFTEAIGGRVPVIYDPATTVPNGSGGFTRTPFPGNAIPADRIDAVALTLLLRYPVPTSAGTANNYRRTANEVDDQDQWDVARRSPIGDRDQVFGRLSNFRDGFVPVTPLPEGSGVTSGTLGPQDTTAWAFASNYQHTFSPTLLNELRIGDTRRTVDASAASLPTTAGAR